MSEQQPPPLPSPGLNYTGNSPVLVDRDGEHVRMLMICWYVFASLVAAGGFFPAVYIVVGLMFVYSSGAFAGPGAPAPPPPGAGWILVILGSVFMFLLWTCAILGFCAARGLQKHKWHTLCCIVAGIACLQIPLGTLLGIFTFIVLSRPTVKASFNKSSPQ